MQPSLQNSEELRKAAAIRRIVAMEEFAELKKLFIEVVERLDTIDDIKSLRELEAKKVAKKALNNFWFKLEKMAELQDETILAEMRKEEKNDPTIRIFG